MSRGLEANSVGAVQECKHCCMYRTIRRKCCAQYKPDARGLDLFQAKLALDEC